ncbi:MFS transporter [Turneriella parva]|uniref:General substrate transporter n=1 Tax=Turneriella parva (strain ATCC BAA-1111 / DSM 21527 / NCTC 11395 / H) TaxID=869212 RepID=I4B7U4_TURPD|nr:MFS transporter [Turneriella parva]AFM13351.1 General substrate transporter [Turneriella parva DSM 21527]
MSQKKKTKHAPMTREEKRVIFAASLGTVFEWYDFYLYGSLAGIISKQFFSGVNETTGFIFALMAFAAGFAVRPFGAIVFGRLGDRVGRKHTFLITILIMGISTALVGVLPSYATIGVTAPIVLVSLRLLQGLALGGEYGGAATYVAEHAPHGRRGFYTSFIQTTATLGLFLSLLVILGCRSLFKADFDVWAWRIPFLLSIALLAISVYIRLQLSESPVFQRMKAEGKTSASPLKDAFAKWKNLKIVLFSLLGGTAGQAVVWYTGQFYALFFLLQILKVEAETANLLIAGALLIGTPFFLFFGALSDRVGRKPVVLLGCLIAAATYFPIFHALTQYANPALYKAAQQSPVTISADLKTCSFQFDPVGSAKFTSGCDVARSVLAKRAVAYRTEPAPPGYAASVKVGTQEISVRNGGNLGTAEFKEHFAAAEKEIGAAVTAAGYPLRADPSRVNIPMVLLLLSLLVIYVTMVYGPIAAWLVELFPTNIRYTSMSLPYHIGNGWFGGFLPTVAFAMVAATGDIYYGLWYPVVVAAASAVMGIFFLPETHRREI